MTSPPPNADRPSTNSDTSGELLVEQNFGERELAALRRTVAAHADHVGLPGRRISDLVLIVSELAANAVRYGGGRGRLRLWTTAEALHCEIADDGPGPPPLPPREPPGPTIAGGRGLWLALQFADSLTLHAGENGGTTAIATIDIPPRPH